MISIHSPTRQRYPDGMVAAEPVTVKPRRLSIRLPRPVWIAVASAVLIVMGVVLRIGLPIYRQQMAIREIEGIRGRIGWTLGGPNWLRALVSDDLMQLLRDDVTAVHLDWTEADDAVLLQLSAFPDIEYLDLNHAEVTDVGLQHLSRLKNLCHLHLENTWVTDAGLKHLHGLTNLKTVYVDPRVTSAGIKELQRALPELHIIR